MLDVHAPHETVHTWRDFFIHIATIVVGLLIAIGLEQSVEYLHHREQLHQLRHDLRAESLRNLYVTLSNIGLCEARHASEAATIVISAPSLRSKCVRKRSKTFPSFASQSAGCRANARTSCRWRPR